MAYVLVDGPTLMHPWTTLIGLLRKSKTCEVGRGTRGDSGAVEGCGAYDQDMLYTCVKFSTNKKEIIKK